MSPRPAPTVGVQRRPLFPVPFYDPGTDLVSEIVDCPADDHCLAPNCQSKRESTTSLFLALRGFQRRQHPEWCPLIPCCGRGRVRKQPGREAGAPSEFDPLLTDRGKRERVARGERESGNDSKSKYPNSIHKCVHFIS
jgi:hypothetical protein